MFIAAFLCITNKSNWDKTGKCSIKIKPKLFPCLSFSDGRREAVSFDKITSRIQKLCYGLNSDFVDPVSSKQKGEKNASFSTCGLILCVLSLQAQITMKVIQGLYSGVTTVELDTLAAETAATLTTKHPDYAILAARIAVSNLHKETKKVFSGR